jgi:hypothetical protein
MSEEEWLAANSPQPLFTLLQSREPIPRKLRLFACACSRAVWDDSWPQRCKEVVITTERFVDGQATANELNRARAQACQAARPAAQAARSRGDSAAAQMFELRLWFAAEAALPESKLHHRITVRYGSWFHYHLQDPFVAGMPTILRDVFGNPFHAVDFSPEWRTDTVMALGRQMYESRDFSAMPILADALQDSGCSEEAILSHCRGSGTHVRGCWCVDLVLGKELS